MTTYELDCTKPGIGQIMKVNIEQIDEVLRVTINGVYLGMLIMDLSELGYSTDDEALKPLLPDLVRCIEGKQNVH